MAFYREFVLPPLCDLAMRARRLQPYRERVAGQAAGRVLEIGAGSGVNLSLYRNADEVLALEPDPKLVEMAKSKAQAAPRHVSFLQASAEHIPLPDSSVDTVVSTWTMCSIHNPVGALREIRRVLKPAGRLLFVEHGLAPTPGVQKWQHRLTPAWKHIAGGCHLDRPIEAVIRQGGFAIEHLSAGYMPGLKIMTFMYEGSAKPT